MAITMDSLPGHQVTGWIILVVALFLSTFGLGVLIYLIAFTSTVIIAIYMALDSHMKLLEPSKYQRFLDPNSRFTFMSGYKPVNFATYSMFQERNGRPVDVHKYHGCQLDVFSGDPVIDDEISSIFKLFFRDYVYSWYAYVSPDDEFPKEIKSMMTVPLQIVCKRMRNIEKVNYFTQNLVDSFATHLRLFRQSVHRESELRIEDPNVDFFDIFFDLESKLDQNDPSVRNGASVKSVKSGASINRGTVSRDEDALFDYLVNLVNVLLYMTLPSECFRNRPLVSVMRSCTVNTVLLPLVEMLSDPDYVNQCLIWICTRSSVHRRVSTDSFLTIIRCTESVEELMAVKDLVVQEMTVLRSRDQETEESFEVKQQLSSLHYLESVMKSRLRSLREGSREDVSGENDHSLFSDRLINLPFEVVLKNNIALSHFIEFMSGIGGQGYVFFYLNVEGYKFSADQKLTSLTKHSRLLTDTQGTHFDTSGASFGTSGSSFGTSGSSLGTGGGSFGTSGENFGKSGANFGTSERFRMESMSEDDLDKLDAVRTAAVNIFDTYLSPCGRQSSQKLLLSPEIVSRIQEALEADRLSEELFDEAWNQSFEVMKNRECFYPSFQKSIGYIKMLQDLDLLRDKSGTEVASDALGTLGGQGNEQILGGLDSRPSSGAKNTNGAKLIANDTDIGALFTISDPDLFMDIEPAQSYASKPPIIGEIESTGIVREFGNCYAVYAISVESHRTASSVGHSVSVGSNSKTNKWCTLRRYSDFLSFHQMTVAKYPQLARIQFPAKKTMNQNLDQEFLEERKHLLNGYLQQILRIFCNRKDLPGFQEHVMKFLEPGEYKEVDTKAGQFLTKTMEKLVLNPFKSVGDVVRSGSDNIRGKLTKLGSHVIPGQMRNIPTGSIGPNISGSSRTIVGPSGGSGQRSSPVPPYSRASSLQPTGGASVRRMASSASTSSLASTGSFGTEKLATNIDLDTEGNIPLRIMLLLMDEVFDLKSKNQWLRRRIVAVVRQIIQATSGDAINKRIVDFVEDSTSPESIAGYLKRFKSNLWPSGFKAAPMDPRSRDVKNRTRVMAKSFLISALSDDLKHIIGSETTRKGLLCVFDMFQNRTLNRRLILVLLESILIELFPENHFPEIFQRLHSINPKSGTIDEESMNGKWPPHLAKFMSEAAFYDKAPSGVKRSSSVRSWK